MSDFDDYFTRMMPGALKWFEQLSPQPLPPALRTLDPDPFGVAWTRRTEPSPFDALAVSALNARKLSAVIEVPEELLMAYGLIPDTRPKPPPPSWRTRLRRKLGDWRERAARRAFRIVAGYWPDNGEDDW